MRGRRRNGTRMAAGVVLSLGLALGSLPVSGITAEPDAADILNAADAQSVTAEASAEESWTEVQPAAEELTDGAVLDAPEVSADTATAAAAAGTSAEVAGQSAGAAQDGRDTAEEIVLPEAEGTGTAAGPDAAEFSAANDGADAGNGTAAEPEDVELFLPEEGGLIGGLEIVAIEDAGTAAADAAGGASAEASAPVGGDCGAVPGTVTWELDESGTLKVSGNGDMASWESPEQVPWDALRGEIRGIAIAEGVTSVGSYAFCGCDAAETVEVAESVSVIGEAAFSHCSGFTTVSIG